MKRNAAVKRKTSETQVEVKLALDGKGVNRISTTIPFFNHMLSSFSKHGLFDLTVRASGDTDVDFHHLVEDVGLCLGQALEKALGDKKGIVRYGSVSIPMDEALVHCAVDLSGRPFVVYQVKYHRKRIGTFDTDLAEEFFRAFAASARMNLHLHQISGRNSHHLMEACFKAAGLALADAVKKGTHIKGIQSTKGAF